MVNKWLKNIQDKLYATTCILCNCVEVNEMALCDACRQELPWLTCACLSCALPLSSPDTEVIPGRQFCGACLQNPLPFSQCHCMFTYDYPVDRLIQQLKFQQKPGYGKILGKLMATLIQQHYQNTQFPDAIVPVPLHKTRLRERGYNQAYEIASSCATQLGIPLLIKNCRRIKATPHQSGLNASTRRKNLRAAFKILPSNSTGLTQNPRSIALVDDVMTTGATLAELSTAFQKSGTKEIHAWCVARTVLH